VHALAVEAGLAGCRISQEDVEAIFARFNVAPGPHLRTHLRAGQALGLWTLLDMRARKGCLIIRAKQPDATPAKPELQA
jgi:hypothetical protein